MSGIAVPEQMTQLGPHGIGPRQPLLLIAGPCVIESEELCLRVAEHGLRVAARLGLPFVFKASFDKANRSSNTGFRGLGLEGGLRILERVRQRFGVLLTSDIHEPSQAATAGGVLDLIQIPAFLCRQTDLLVAAARTGKPINIKKGQFMSPAEMANAAEKVRAEGNRALLLTERGTFFGYNRLVNDMTAIADMRTAGQCPVIFDATHSTQLPGGLGSKSGGRPEMAALLARAAVAAGADGLFVEIHPNPTQALSDAATQLPLEELEALLRPLRGDPCCCESDVMLLVEGRARRRRCRRVGVQRGQKPGNHSIIG